MFLSCTVNDIVSVEYWRDLEIWVMGHSRLLNMAPIDRSYTTYYWSVVVNIVLSCTIFKLFGVQGIMLCSAGYAQHNQS